MISKHFEQKVMTINDRRRENKAKNDLMSKSVNPGDLTQVFNTYYKDQVAALYRAVRTAR
jgi:hypothetical protein